LQILRLSDDLSPAIERMREIMERQVDQMVRLVDDLLEVSRITRGKIELRREPVELAVIIRSALETSRPLIDACGHQLAITVSPEPMTLDADPIRLAQVVANLLNNAAKYTEQRGQIWLTARRDGNEALISVRDNGVGISSEMLPRVFDMFAQVDRTLSRAQGGLGIGLSLAQSLVHLHGGRIEARSQGSGQGSEFLIRLPLMLDNSTSLAINPAAGATEKHSRHDSSLQARRVLIVDDTPGSAFILGKLLEAMGHHVTVFHDPIEALMHAPRYQPDVVISDIAMPNLDGYELARRLRQSAELDRAILVALTGYGQDSDRQRAKDAGFDHHLVKPASTQSLLALLNSLPRHSLLAADRPQTP
jgi:CheY-like chemotaxis protein